MKKTLIGLTLVITLIVGTSMYLFPGPANITPVRAYEVYIDGRSIGFIRDRERLDHYINTEQTAIKDEFGVDNVYMPLGVKVQERTTFTYNFITEREVYEHLKKADLFAIDGYTITIHGERPTVINVLDRSIFEEAIDRTIKNFVDPELYDSFIREEEIVIETTGTRIDNAAIQENITIRKGLVSTGDFIYTDVNDLNRFLLFGTLEPQRIHRVGRDESLRQIAERNRLSIEEIMVANPDINSPDTLLYHGQELNIGLIRPLIHVEIEEYRVSDKTVNFDTQTRFDNNQMIGYERVERQGINGMARVTERVRRVNGEIIPPVIPINTEELSPAVDRVVVLGGQRRANVGTGAWRWPTITPYTLSSPFGWRWGRMHTGIDISGTGHGSPIFAANNGVVTFAGNWGAYGNTVVINHNNGFWTLYAHLSRIHVRQGQVVSRAQIIGAMGNTGRSFGTHLHFEIRTGDPRTGGRAIDPLPLLRR